MRAFHLEIGDVLNRTGLPRSSLERMLRDGRFPRPLALGTRRRRWAVADIEQWESGAWGKGGDAWVIEVGRVRVSLRNATSRAAALKVSWRMVNGQWCRPCGGDRETGSAGRVMKAILDEQHSWFPDLADPLQRVQLDYLDEPETLAATMAALALRSWPKG